jgi:hypothetical protein
VFLTCYSSPDANPPDSTEKVSCWIEEITCSPIQDEPEKELENIDDADAANTTTVSQSLFTSVSERDYGKFLDYFVSSELVMSYFDQSILYL